MRPLLIFALLILGGCASQTSQDRWNSFAASNSCVQLEGKKTLLAGSVYTIPQRRVVYLFECNGQQVWSDLGSYAKYNEWLTI